MCQIISLGVIIQIFMEVYTFYLKGLSYYL